MYFFTKNTVGCAGTGSLDPNEGIGGAFLGVSQEEQAEETFALRLVGRALRDYEKTIAACSCYVLIG